MKHATHPLLTAACLAALGSTACSELIVADFEDPIFVVGQDAQNGLPGSPAGDVLLTSGDVTVVSDSGTGMGKHILLNASDTLGASATFSPASGPQGDNVKLSFEGFNHVSGLVLVEVWAANASEPPFLLSVSTFALNGSGQVGFSTSVADPSTSAGLTNILYSEGFLLDGSVPHWMHIRFDKTYGRVFTTVASNTPNAPDTIHEGESALDVDFDRIESVVFHACAENEPTSCSFALSPSTGAYRLNKLQLTHWTEQQQYHAAETARRYGFIPASTHPDGRTSLDDEVTMFYRALDATAATLNRYLDPATVAMVQFLQR